MIKIPDQQLKEILIKDKVVSEADFASLSSEAQRMGQSVPQILISRNVITSDYYKNLVATFFNVPNTNLEPSTVNNEALGLLSEEFAREKQLVPFRKQPNGVIDVAMADPSDLATIEYLEKKFEAKVQPYLASPEDLSRVFAFYGKQQVENFKKIIQENIQKSLQLRSKKDSEAAVEVPIIEITDNILSYALSMRSSDVHIEALENEILVRYRIDGVLHEIIRIQKEILPAIVARFKILSGMKLDEHARPQDGRFRYKIGTELIDVRTSILPTMYGEKVELRLLTAAAHVLSFEELGMLPETIKIVRDNATKSYGVMLVTGPTGSGKSTTLYSILNTLNKPEVNIITVEDPIEYEMKYVNQTQVNEQAGISFASALRSILRQDPNIIMVGEIRDQETAEISVHAALTGHLVLSSLHTNDAPTAIPRLMDMHIEPFLISAVLNAAIAQRLVRRICAECMYSYETTPEITEAIEKQLKELGIEPGSVKTPGTLFKGKGCQACGTTGYRGRLGIYEILEVNEKIRNFIASSDFKLDGLKNLARSLGMRSMFEDGLLKVGQGLTTIEEVMRVIRE